MVQCFQKDVNNSKKQNSVKNIAVDRFATIEQKQICGYIVKQIFYAIFCLISKLFKSSVRWY